MVPSPRDDDKMMNYDEGDGDYDDDNKYVTVEIVALKEEGRQDDDDDDDEELEGLLPSSNQNGPQTPTKAISTQKKRPSLFSVANLPWLVLGAFLLLYVISTADVFVKRVGHWWQQHKSSSTVTLHSSSSNNNNKSSTDTTATTTTTATEPSFITADGSVLFTTTVNNGTEACLSIMAAQRNPNINVSVCDTAASASTLNYSEVCLEIQEARVESTIFANDTAFHDSPWGEPVEELPSDYKLCHLQPAPKLHHGPVGIDTPSDNPLQPLLHAPEYQCAGEPYFDFLQHYMYPYILEQQSNNNKWGRRTSMLPPNKKILVLGNSHMRQLYLSLLCQYHDQIVSSRRLQPDTVDWKWGLANEYVLEGNTTIYFFNNHGLFYSRRWHLTLEEIMGQPLQEMDAIVLGLVNRYVPWQTCAWFWQTMMEYPNVFPSHEVDVLQNPTGMNLLDVTNVYKGPIISVSMFGAFYEPWWQERLDHMTHLQQKRTNLRAINVQQHGEPMGAECGTATHTKVLTCLARSDPSYHESHKCMGAMGGQPDMAAWDLLEALHEFF